MDFSLARENLLTLAKNPNDIFAVGKDNKIEAISRYDIFGRFWCWITGTSNTKKVRDAILSSVDSVYSHFQEEHATYSKEGRFFYLKHDIEVVKTLRVVDKGIQDKAEKLLNEKVNPASEKMKELGKLFKGL